NKEKSASGLGGMTSKLTFARLANMMGIKSVIFGVRTEDGILKAIDGRTGTLCLPQPSTLPARKRWLASGSLVKGQLQIDAGAESTLKKRRSLLEVGVKNIAGEVEQGEVFEILDEQQNTIAVAKAKISSASLRNNLKTKNLEVANAI